MSRNVGPRRIDDVSQIELREEPFYQLLAELALHERVGGDLSDVPGRVAAQRQIEQSLGERYAHGVLHAAGRVAGSVQLVDRLVLHRDVGRVPDHHVILLAEDAVQGVEVFGLEGVRELRLAGERVLFRAAAQVQLPEAAPVEQAVAGGHVERERRRLLQAA